MARVRREGKLVSHNEPLPVDPFGPAGNAVLAAAQTAGSAPVTAPSPINRALYTVPIAAPAADLTERLPPVE